MCLKHFSKGKKYIKGPHIMTYMFVNALVRCATLLGNDYGIEQNYKIILDFMYCLF